MSQNITSAIQSQIRDGQTKEEIIAKLLTDGHTQETAAMHYEQATQLASIDPQTAILSRISSRLMITIGVVVIVALLLGYWLYSASSTSLLGGLFQSTPYATADELFLGTALSVAELAQGVNVISMTYDLELKPKVPGEIVPVIPDATDFVSMVESNVQTTLPEKGYLTLQLDGVFDTRNAATPAFDVTIELDMMLEPFVLSGTGAARLVEENIYVRVDSVPALIEPFYKMFVATPVGSWMLLGTQDAAGGLLGTSTAAVTLDTAAMTDVEMAANTAELGGTDTSNGIVSVFETMTFLYMQDELDTAAFKQLLKESPPFSMVAKPVSIETEQGDRYRYHIALHRSNLVTVLETIPELVPPAQRSEMTVSVQEMITQVPDQATFDLWQEAAQVYVDVSPRGVFQSVQVESTFTESVESNIIISLDFTLDVQPTSATPILAPDVLNTESVLGGL
jgi:hypothetical protein